VSGTTHSRDLSGRGAARAEDAQGTPTQGHVSPSSLVYEDTPIGYEVEPTVHEVIPTVYEVEPTVYEVESTVYEVEPRWYRAEQALAREVEDRDGVHEDARHILPSIASIRR
jgi:hypothetical protein